MTYESAQQALEELQRLGLTALWEQGEKGFTIFTPTPVRCRVIEAGEGLRSTDWYASSSGMWDLCPCPGVKYQRGGALFVRPL